MTVFGLFFVAFLLLMSRCGDDIRAFVFSFATMGDIYNVLLGVTIFMGVLEVYLIVRSIQAIKWEVLEWIGRYIPWALMNALMIGFAIYMLLTWSV